MCFNSLDIDFFVRSGLKGISKAFSVGHISENSNMKMNESYDVSDFLRALYSVYKKLGQFFSILYSLYASFCC